MICDAWHFAEPSVITEYTQYIKSTIFKEGSV